MRLDVLYKIKNDERAHHYLRNNSEWYKYLNRTPEALPYFMEDVKKHYKMRPTDKLTNLSDRIEMIKTFMNLLG